MNMKDHQGETALAKAVSEENLADAETIRVAEAKAKDDKAAAEKAEADRSVLL